MGPIKQWEIVVELRALQGSYKVPRIIRRKRVRLPAKADRTIAEGLYAALSGQLGPRREADEQSAATA